LGNDYTNSDAGTLLNQRRYESHNPSDPMAILMDDAFERDIGKEYETPGIDVERGYRFDIVIGGRNATFFEGRS
jgi:hypothetical protein